MAHHTNRNATEGYSITRPPLFDEISFDFWKTRMMTFLQSIDFRMWIIVEQGYEVPTNLVNGKHVEKLYQDWTQDEREWAQLNAKTLNSFCCALKQDDYMRISTCKSGKEIWDSVCLTYEGTNEVR